ncbi:hypothetical protein Athai_59300 [Actinocatenispora thailandica]|uniref:DUF885 domain-containing protein n=1 Tax=Actinocatenispora thailandica TaxID=227318 RepID=A0A7R7DV53_9ACTN|nr:DUF885 domain-containing protein [Actinocatenispora thailandica]BCJ38427.1 hypothetical protein Athai_59300 [Actinocatenispora thailandica]
MGRIDEIADRYVDDWATLDPAGATEAGVVGHDDEMPDLTPDGYAARAELNRRVLAELAGVEPADERERAAKAAMQERLGLEVEIADAGEDREMNVIASPVHGLRQTFDLMPLAGEEAASNVASRLEKLPRALDQLRTTLSADAAAGRVASRRQLAACVDQYKEWTGTDDFFAGLATRVGAEGALGARIAAAAAGARQAVDEFGGFVTGELLPRAAESDAAGLEKYQRASRYFLGASIDLAETYEWGWQELARIETEMRRVAGQIVPGSSSIVEAAAALDADPKRRIAGKEAFREWMQRQADEAIAAVDGVHFDIPEPVRTIEACIAPTSDGAIYYTPPSEDWSRPGRMWWAVPNGVEEFATWREVTTVYHEGVPGHHLQVGQTVYRSELLNRWQRLLCWVSGSGEGWALYAERLMDDLGFLSDPGARLGMLDAQSFRATRVIIDIGMHLQLKIPAGTGFHEGETWTPELGWEFLRAHCRMEEEFLRFELLRYLGWPGQAPAYKVGERMWLAAREEARARKGADFDLKAFHAAALDLGSIGLDPLREALARL